jgi:hypothetical protein
LAPSYLAQAAAEEPTLPSVQRDAWIAFYPDPLLGQVLVASTPDKT